jgi:lipopolysaccharide transport system ATP-binding protein
VAAIIRIENLGKCYRISHAAGQAQAYRTLRESLTQAALSTWQRLGRVGASGGGDHRRREWAEDFWALRDVCFEVEPSEVLGIIGRNGAGKSTLLKILSRITKPTTGRVELFGRVGSLLEVGTGFHPELTGRENIYLNGSILGMSRREIAKNFEEIVSFSEIEKFLDTPVKRYSSGMYVRLAFAVAAHLNPEVLVVDEVLAVGDTGFQQKCLGKMNSIAKSGRTVLFVSHNIAAIENLCTRVIRLERGSISDIGFPSKVCGNYLKSTDAEGPLIDLLDHPGRREKRLAPVLRKLVVCDSNHELTTAFRTNDSIVFRIAICPNDAHNLRVSIYLSTMSGFRLAMLHSQMQQRVDIPRFASVILTCKVPALPLLPGEYRIDVGAASDDFSEFVEGATTISIIPGDVFGTGRYPEPQQGSLALPAAWSVESGTEDREDHERQN